MNCRLRPPRSLWVRIALGEAVILGIGVDQHAGRAALLGDEDLHAAKVAAVANKNYLAFQVDMLGRQQVKILQPSVIGVDHIGAHIS